MVGRAAGIDPGFTDLSQPPSPTPPPSSDPSTIPSPGGRSYLPPATSIRDANPPPTVCFRSLFHSARPSLHFSFCPSRSPSPLYQPSSPLSLPLSRCLCLSLFLSPPPCFSFSLPPRASSSSQRHQLSSTPPATPNCSRVSNRGASRVTLQVADRFAATFGSDCSGHRRAV